MKFSIPEPELVFRATRAGGPGGQHVNKASTRMEVLWDFEHSAVLSDEERVRVRVKLANRIDAEGFLRIAADERRSLTQNRTAAIERLTELVDHARRAPKPRKLFTWRCFWDLRSARRSYGTAPAYWTKKAHIAV